MTSRASADTITLPSPWSVDDTVARIVKTAEGRGLAVFAVIDHGGEARKVRLKLRETKVVIFGAPAAGTPVMQAVPLAALDLPLKVLVWDDDGQTGVTYLRPEGLAARYGIEPELSARLAGIDAVVSAALEP